ncbi:hypothetical protein CONCODRAFT_13156 [Conidiobolus coronatus NRRL 28638]|uniref:Uncharacterized protein n=1 Tax=Conidiobolus coronatus (strain ATCC 28846 / CBS 209.66 / NRRL 28638) TaxID=796925 RepID=A0A137NRA7_CONC2|nr:hypothetical protein CONCODRAFT_13156 [Conidiobolus coronatus NRRL 28638]|eukprot:KXN65299.1 hypothetical protein CONCODRAFT_13156 [Conidiobolus coronatus NRRL 28638]
MTLYALPNIETPGEITNEQLKVKVLTTEAISFIFPDFKHSLIAKELEKFILPGISTDDIINKHESQLKLSYIQSEFIFKLKQLISESKQDKLAKNRKSASNEFIWFLLQNSGLIQENELDIKFNRLTFVYKLNFYDSFADFTAERGNSIVWTLNNPHHSKLPKKTDSNHAATSMIAAIQINRRCLQKVFPERMIGISVIDDKFTFYSTKIAVNYLDEVFKGNVTQDLNIYQYPSKNGLSICDEKERFEILKILSNLKEYTMSLPVLSKRSYA